MGKERSRDEMYSSGTACTSSLAAPEIFKTKGRRRRAGGGIEDRYVSGYEEETGGEREGHKDKRTGELIARAYLGGYVRVQCSFSISFFFYGT